MSVITVTGEQCSQYMIIADAASEYLRLRGEAEVELITLSPSEIRELNAQMRGVDKETDVLSFPSLELNAGSYEEFCENNYPFDVNPDDKKVVLGSIAICNEVAALQAAEYGHSTEREKGYLFLHGLLHLLGYDHMTDGDKRVMREAEERILNGIGLSR